jgi:hypothetical protein
VHLDQRTFLDTRVARMVGLVVESVDLELNELVGDHHG